MANYTQKNIPSVIREKIPCQKFPLYPEIFSLSVAAGTFLILERNSSLCLDDREFPCTLFILLNLRHQDNQNSALKIKTDE
jgi:hypothetical protein